MTWRVELTTTRGLSGKTFPKPALHATLEAIDAGCRHLIDPAFAVLSNGDISCHDVVTGEKVTSSGTAPTIGTSIGGKPTLEFGSGTSGILGQMLRGVRTNGLDIGTGAWSICMVIKAGGIGSTDIALGYVPGAGVTSADKSPYVRFAAGIGKTLIPSLVGNDGVVRSLCATKEFYNTPRLLVITHTPGVGIHWFVDNWSTHEAFDSSDEAKLPFTDGRFLIGSLSAGFASLNLAGSLGILSVHDYDLYMSNVRRSAWMTAIAGHYGITST